MNNPRSRRPDFNAVKKISSSHSTLHQFGFLALILSKLLHHVGPKLLVHSK